MRNYDPISPITPARIAGDLDGIDDGERLAVALNGRVVATTFSYSGDHGTEFAAMIPPRLIEIGDNELGVLAIEGDRGDLTLRPLRLSF